MCELFALSSQQATKVTFSLEEFSRHGGRTGPHADGWGLAFYEGPDAHLFRESGPAASSDWMGFLLMHSCHSRCVVSHIRQATTGDVALRNTQPYSRELGGKRHIFCHNGDLTGIQGLARTTQFTPIGETDSEFAFCYLMDRLSTVWQGKVPAIDVRIAAVSDTLRELATLGPANILYSDSEYLYAFANRRTHSNGRVEAPGMYFLERHCECDPDALQDSVVRVHNMAQDIVLFGSVPLSQEGWHGLDENQLIVAQYGRIVTSINL